MKSSKYASITFLVVTVILASACGGGSDKKSQFVNISSAFRCAISAGVVKPANCMIETIEGSSYVTDQNTIHLFGTSSPVEDDGCPEPNLFELEFCIPTFPYNYGVSWNNSRNGASGLGNVAYLFIGSTLEPVLWTTYDPAGVIIGYADPKGIPLEMGSNTLHITTGNSGLTGNAEITITRVVDVTPPTVYSVDPIPDGTYRRMGITVYFSEQLDPASVTTALLVVDDIGQQTLGTVEFDPRYLKVRWRPQVALNQGTSYTVRVSGVTDLSGNIMIDPYEWSFVTPP